MTKLRLGLGLTAGTVLHWIALIASYRSVNFLYRKLPEQLIDMGTAPFSGVGGFPIRVFEYPHPPLGTGVPLTSMDSFFLHLLIWVAVATLIAFILPKNWVTKNATIIATSLAVIATIIGVVYLLVKFD